MVTQLNRLFSTVLILILMFTATKTRAQSGDDVVPPDAEATSEDSETPEELPVAPVFPDAPAEDLPAVPAPASVDPYERMLSAKYSLFNHRRTFMMPVSYVDNPSRDLYPSKQYDPNNRHDFYTKTEAEFQISFFIPVSRKLFQSSWDIMFAYTHHAWWQVYNTNWSRPFRETIYVPEVFARNFLGSRAPKVFGFNLVAYDLGYAHESNGQILLISRSWNRLFARAALTNLHRTTLIALSGWYRLPDGPGDDDNPTIQTYRGIGSVEFQKSMGSHTIELEVPLAAKPGVELRYSYPWKSGLRWFVDVRYGFGQSLIEYNRETRRIGVGLMLENFIDQG